jgi:Protein of unknown function (DUF4031)
VTVYVDDMYRYPMGQFGRMKMSHLIADTEEELHAMAAAIGIARRWYQGDHYDISMGKRDEAIQRGAVPIPLRTLGVMCAIRRKTGRLPTPEETYSFDFKMRIRGIVTIKRSSR